MRQRSIAALFFGLGAVTLTACPEAETITVEKTAAEHGADLFADKTITVPANEFSCATCHAETADQTNLILPGAPLAGATKRSSYWGGQELTLLGAINHCRYYFMLASTDWTGDEADAEAIYAYLESLEPGDAAAQTFTLGPVADPGDGDATRGKGLYQRACGTCHGDKSTGARKTSDDAPILPDETIAAHPEPSYSDDDRRLVFVEKTRHGTFYGYGGQMPPFSSELLSDQDLADILAYLGVP